MIMTPTDFLFIFFQITNLYESSKLGLELYRQMKKQCSGRSFYATGEINRDIFLLNHIIMDQRWVNRLVNIFECALSKIFFQFRSAI